MRGVNRRSLSPSTFNTKHPIDIIFGTYNKPPLHFQLSIAALFIGFHYDEIYINDVRSGRYVRFKSFQILFTFKL